jgi:hypothetical protein
MEIMEGRMHPVRSREKTEVTRQAFLLTMALIVGAVLGHLSFLVSAQVLGPLLLGK